MSQVKDRFLVNDENGFPLVNEYIAAALASVSPAVDPAIDLGNLVNWNSTVALAGLKAAVGVKVLGARIGNLDSFGSPLQVLDPVIGEAKFLNNSISLGVGAKPVRFDATVHITVTDYGECFIGRIIWDIVAVLSHSDLSATRWLAIEQ